MLHAVGAVLTHAAGTELALDEDVELSFAVGAVADVGGEGSLPPGTAGAQKGLFHHNDGLGVHVLGGWGHWRLDNAGIHLWREMRLFGL